MNEYLQNKLYKVDPIFFKHAINCREGIQNQMDSCMYFGCQCGNGWYKSLQKFAQKIWLLNRIFMDRNLSIVCDQIKQKYSQCTIYYHIQVVDQNKEYDQKEEKILSKIVSDIYHRCVDDCYEVCQWCGKSDERMVSTKGWMSRICRECSKQYLDREFQHCGDKETIMIFSDGYQFLSLYQDRRFKYKDNIYNSIIQAFYSQKDCKHRQIYRQIKDGKVIQKVSKQFGIKFEDNQEDYKLLKDIVQSKFSKDFSQLVKTQNKKLEYRNKNCDNILGICNCDKCNKNQSKNLYGKILMQIRQKFNN